MQCKHNILISSVHQLAFQNNIPFHILSSIWGKRHFLKVSDSIPSSLYTVATLLGQWMEID